MDMSNAFMTNLTAMSLLALLVGIFLIYNSVAFAVLQRRSLIGVLRALGMTRGQTFSLILIEGVILGITGAVLGVILGIFLGEQLLGLVSRTISDHYFVVNVTDVQAALAAFLRKPNAPSVVRVDLDGDTPNGLLNVTDIQLVLLAIMDRPYPFVGPLPCP